MIDILAVVSSVPEFLTHHILPYIDQDAADAVGDAVEHVDEVAETVKEVARQHREAADALVAKKHEQTVGFLGLAVLPVSMVAVAFAIKLIYGMFVKTADTVGEGVKSATSKLKAVIDEGPGSGKETAKAASGPTTATRKRRLLFGEIIKRYVNSTVTDGDIEVAVKAQKEMKQSKKIGEIMVDKKLITSSDVTKALKIQDKT